MKTFSPSPKCVICGASPSLADTCDSCDAAIREIEKRGRKISLNRGSDLARVRAFKAREIARLAIDAAMKGERMSEIRIKHKRNIIAEGEMVPERELAELRRDAERLDWLEENEYWFYDFRQGRMHDSGQTVREAIDAEMKEEQGEKE